MNNKPYEVFEDVNTGSDTDRPFCVRDTEGKPMRDKAGKVRRFKTREAAEKEAKRVFRTAN